MVYAPASDNKVDDRSSDFGKTRENGVLCMQIEEGVS